jgi:hypothetical protein
VLQLAEVNYPNHILIYVVARFQDAAYVTKELIMDRMRWDERRVDVVLVRMIAAYNFITVFRHISSKKASHGLTVSHRIHRNIGCRVCFFSNTVIRAVRRVYRIVSHR